MRKSMSVFACVFSLMAIILERASQEVRIRFHFRTIACSQGHLPEERVYSLCGGTANGQLRFHLEIRELV